MIRAHLGTVAETKVDRWMYGIRRPRDNDRQQSFVRFDNLPFDLIDYLESL